MHAFQYNEAHSGATYFTMIPYSIEEWTLRSNLSPKQPGQEQPEDANTRARKAAKFRLMEIAEVIEPDAHRRSDWWTRTPIVELGSLTADELVAQGMQNLVEKFLLAILFGDRD